MTRARAGVLAAAVLFSGAGPASAGPIEDLEAKDAGARIAAVAALKKSAGPAEVAALRERLKGSARPEVMFALGKLGPRAKSAVPDLIAILKTGDYEARLHAAEALHEIGAPAVPALLGVLEDPAAGSEARRGAGQALGGLEAALPGLLRLLAKPGSPLPAPAIRAVGMMGADGAAAVPALLERFKARRGGWKDEDYAVVDALGMIGPAAKAAAGELSKYAKGPDLIVHNHVDPALDLITKTRRLPPKEAERLVGARAAGALRAIKEKDWGRLAHLIHPVKGVRLSLTAYVDLDQAVLSRADIEAIPKNTVLYPVGDEDGSGRPASSVTLSGYFENYVYDKDFLAADEITYNRSFRGISLANNAFEFYPEAVIVEHHFSGFDPARGYQDWASLRLAFEEDGGVWYLVGVAHDQWSI